MSRAIIATLVVVFAAPAPAAGETIRVAPASCPIPADITPYEGEDVSAYELNPWTDRLDDVLLFRDIPVAGGAFALRIFADPVTGDIYGFPTEPADCETDPDWPQ